MRYVSPARKHLPVALAWETRAALSHAAFSRPRTRVDRLERMSISVAISRWADVRVTMLRGRALSWARLAHQQPLFMQRSGAPGVGAIACSEHLRLRWLRVHERVSKGGERRKKIEMTTTEHARSNLGGAHGCMRLWVAVTEKPHAARDAHAHEQTTDSCAFWQS